MKYNIHGFSQEKAVDLKLDNDSLLIIRWLVDFSSTGKMQYHDKGNKRFYWVSYEKVLEDLPILGIKKDSLYKKLKKICSTRVLEHITVRTGGVFSYYGIGEKYIELINHSEKNPNLKEKNPNGTEKNPEGVRKKIRNKDYSINNNSINNKKHIYGEYKKVLLTDKEFSNLETKLGKEVLNQYIIDLDSYIASSGKKYKSHSATIQNWHRKDNKEGKKVTKNSSVPNMDNFEQRQYTADDFEKYYYKVTE